MLLDDLAALEALAVHAATTGGAHVLGSVTHRFDPQGVSVLLLLAESHLSVHTWPEAGAAYVDVFTCGEVPPSPILLEFVGRLGGTAQLLEVGRQD